MHIQGTVENEPVAAYEASCPRAEFEPPDAALAEATRGSAGGHRQRACRVTESFVLMQALDILP